MKTNVDQYFERQIIMPEIGLAGQARLKASSVLVVGAGGLGSPILFGLAGAGVGRIGIVDHDRVSASNLNRQFLFTPSDIGLLKAEQARSRLLEYHPELVIDAFTERLEPVLAASLFGSYDIIIGAVDNVQTRRFINAICCLNQKTWIDGGISGFTGYVAWIVPGRSPCYDCLFGFSDKLLAHDNKQADQTEGSDSVVPITGVIGVTAGVVGSLEASLAVMFLLGMPDPLKGELFYYFGKQMATTRVEIKRDPDCLVCGQLFLGHER